MRCQCCKKVVPTANKPSRLRRICGNCLRSINKLINTIPMSVINE